MRCFSLNIFAPLCVYLCTLVACDAQSDVQSALQILQTSLDRNERIRALVFMRDQDRLPVSAGFELGRIILSDGDEAGYACVALARLGDASFPIMAKLLESGSFDAQL